jgi:hypothetical protein
MIATEEEYWISDNMSLLSDFINDIHFTSHNIGILYVTHVQQSGRNTRFLFMYPASLTL